MFNSLSVSPLNRAACFCATVCFHLQDKRPFLRIVFAREVAARRRAPACNSDSCDRFSSASLLRSGRFVSAAGVTAEQEDGEQQEHQELAVRSLPPGLQLHQRVFPPPPLAALAVLPDCPTRCISAVCQRLRDIALLQARWLQKETHAGSMV